MSAIRLELLQCNFLALTHWLVIASGGHLRRVVDILRRRPAAQHLLVLGLAGAAGAFDVLRCHMALDLLTDRLLLAIDIDQGAGAEAPLRRCLEHGVFVAFGALRLRILARRLKKIALHLRLRGFPGRCLATLLNLLLLLHLLLTHILS